MNRVRNNIISLVVIALIVMLSAWIVFGGNRTTKVLGTDVDLNTKLGLDLQGGYQILLQARDTGVSKERMEVARNIIEKRVNGLGTNEPTVTIQGDNRISVELPGVTDEEQVKKAIGSTGRLEFIEAGTQSLNDGDTVQTTYCTTGSLFDKRSGLCGVNAGTSQSSAAAAATPAVAATTAAAAAPGATPAASPTVTNTGKLNASGQPYQTVITGEQLDSSKISVGFSDVGGAQKVLFGVKSEAAPLFGQFTGANIGKQMAIVLDGRVISAANINGVISNQGEISSSRWSTPAGKAEVQGIVLQLKYGSLPVEMDVQSSRKVGATLGTDSIDRSVIAGIVGLGIVGLFMLLYYRVPGMLAVIALLIYSVITFSIFKLFGVVLTLAGIAGFILSIGMAVDANVLIFARMKEEMRLGRNIERAVEEGFKNAWPSIRDSNISTLITCAILYWFGDFTGTSTIKGFALTLALGVACSLFSALFVTHTFLRTLFLVIGGQRQFRRGGWWFGMNRTRRATTVEEAI